MCRTIRSNYWIQVSNSSWNSTKFSCKKVGFLYLSVTDTLNAGWEFLFVNFCGNPMSKVVRGARVQTHNPQIPSHKVEICTDPTRAHFWPIVNKKPTWLWPGYFLSQPDEIFIDLKGKKLKNLEFLGGNIPNPNPNQRLQTQPDPSNKIFDLNTSLPQRCWITNYFVLWQHDMLKLVKIL